MDLYDKYCSNNKNDFSQDKDILDILSGEQCADKIITACKLARQKQNSPVIRLNADKCLRISNNSSEIPDIEAAADYVCTRDASILMECISGLSGIPLVLEVSGGFSSLLAAAGSGYIFRQLRKNEVGILSAVRLINSHTVGLIKSATALGVKIISFADPSALVSVMGERRFAELSAEPSLGLIRDLSGINGVLLHLCPRISFALEKYCGCIFRPCFNDRSTVSEKLLDMVTPDEFVLTGHVCIGADTDKESPLYIMGFSPEGIFYE